MPLEFNQKTIELEISAVLESGDITQISRVSGIGYSYIDQQFNPNDERKSAIFCALKIICALDEISAERGEMLWNLVAGFRERSKPKKAAGGCLHSCAASVSKESSEAVSAPLLGKPLLEQLKETLDAETAIKKQKQAILDAINNEKENGAAVLKVVG